MLEYSFFYSATQTGKVNCSQLGGTRSGKTDLDIEGWGNWYCMYCTGKQYSALCWKCIFINKNRDGLAVGDKDGEQVEHLKV